MTRWWSCVLIALAGYGCVIEKGETPETGSKVATGLALSRMVQQQRHLLTTGSYGVGWSGGYDRSLRLYESLQKSTVAVPPVHVEAFWSGLRASVAAEIGANARIMGEGGGGAPGGIRSRQYQYLSGPRAGVVQLLVASGEGDALHIMLLNIEHAM